MKDPATIIFILAGVHPEGEGLPDVSPEEWKNFLREARRTFMTTEQSIREYIKIEELGNSIAIDFQE